MPTLLDPPVAGAARPRPDRAMLARLVLVPALIAAAGMACAGSGIDRWATDLFFDPAAAAFPARSVPALETIGHRLAKSAVWALWLGLLAAAVAARRFDRLRPHQAVLWLTVAALATGPALVTLLKNVTAPRCPWDLQQYGGFAQASTALFAHGVPPGHCFPGGHAAGGFSLIALHFAGLALGNRRLARAGLWAALTAGTLFSLVRVAQGAHFVSHNLWAAAIDWAAAAWIFAPLQASWARAGGRP